MRRLVDNDLLSAHADRHESLAFWAGAMAAGSGFLTMLLAQKYYLAFGSPGQTALMILEDKFLLIALAMIVMALATVAQWDALALDARDAAILSPLPIRTRELVAAKAAAIGLFSAGAAMALTLAPSVLHPIFATTGIRIGLVNTARLIGAQLVASILAAAFAFLAVLAWRESLRLVLGQRGFARISGMVQALLVLGLVTSFLLIVGGAAGSATSLTGAGGPKAGSRLALPALWFLGLAETLGGNAIIPANAIDDNAIRAYTSRQPRFRQLARTGLLATGVAGAVGAVAYAWNSRRLPQPLPRSRRRRRLRDASRRVANLLVARTALQRAGFFFTLHALTRSAPQRIALSVALAVAVALTAATFGGSGLAPPLEEEPVRLSVWALQTFIMMAMMVGVRHAMAVPAELRANWIFHQCWPEDLRAFTTGVRRTALVVVALPAVLGLLPFHAYLLGGGTALFHSLIGVLIARLLLTPILSGRRMPPFISSYVSRGNLKLAPLHLLGAAIFALSLAGLERASSASLRGGAMFAIGLVLVIVGIEIVQMRRAAPISPEIADAPDASLQTLGLTG